MMQDLRDTDLYREIVRLCADVRRPGTGRISDAAQMHVSPNGDAIVFAASIAEQVDADPPTRLALTDLTSGDTRVLTDGPHSDRLPRFSADGGRIAFLSDRHRRGDAQLHFVDLATGKVRAAAVVHGSVEHLQWSADDAAILLRVVEPLDGASGELPAWMPQVDAGDGPDERRYCWIYTVATDTVRRIGMAEHTVWEAAWCGSQALVTVTADTAGENGWYGARLMLEDMSGERQRTLYDPADQLGPPLVSPDGATVAVVEGLCSDRGPVIGELRLIDVASGACRTVDLRGVDAVHGEWRSERALLVSGYRGLTSVIGIYEVDGDLFRELWASDSLSVTAGCVAGLGHADDCIVIAEGFQTAPQVATIRAGRYEVIRSLDIGYAAAIDALASAEAVSWASADGLTIEGLLLRPPGPGPHPTIVNIHGGPIAHWRPGFLIRRLLIIPPLLARGYAVFMPNPRGSTGRGQAFARRVMGDIGGADAQDILTGIDALIARGIADSGRIGITGVSYGGFMTSWLITQCDRFAAAVSVSPHTNQVTAHLLSNIPGFMARLLGDEIGNLGGQYFERSPVFAAGNVRTPTLSIAGALDRCTPPGEAAQFHQALREAGVESALAIYPQEGHGIRRLPAAIDCAARVVDWLIDHIPDRREETSS